MTQADDAAVKLVVIVNGEAIIEYDRNQALPEAQMAYLDSMDEFMDEGIDVGDVSIEAPDPVEKATFVANNLIEALRSDNEPAMAASCAWLANRLPELQQIKAEDRGEETHVELIFDRPYAPEVKVNLT